MAELLLVNPRRRKKARRRKGRMPAALAAYWAGRRRGGGSRRRRKSHARHATRRRRNPSYRHHARRRRRNPSFRGLASGFRPAAIMSTVKQGFVGSVGALGNDLLMGQLFSMTWWPAALGTGLGAAASKGLGAILVGLLGGMVWRGKGRDLADGAMTVALHGALRAQLSTLVPTLPLAPMQGMGEYLTFAPTVGFTGANNPQLGEYITNDLGNPDFYGQNYPGAVNASGQMGLYLT